jgi:hypothetical protein
MKLITLVVAFALELVAFVFFSLAAFLLPVDSYLQYIITAVLFVGVITFWGLFMSPRAIRKLGVLPYYVLKFFIYAVAAMSLLKLTRFVYFALFIVVAVGDELLLFWQDPHSS